MGIQIIEIKARCNDSEKIRNILKNHEAEFKGVDHQIDTYFKVANGRLKLREGNIENTLIHYHRPNQAGPKKSEVSLFRPPLDPDLKTVLTKANGILTVVDKQREIYFIDNVKFHIDEVKNLGSFVEIEAIDEDGSIGLEKINAQCQHYVELFNIAKQDLMINSYSDMLLQQ